MKWKLNEELGFQSHQLHSLQVLSCSVGLGAPAWETADMEDFCHCRKFCWTGWSWEEADGSWGAWAWDGREEGGWASGEAWLIILGLSFKVMWLWTNHLTFLNLCKVEIMIPFGRVFWVLNDLNINMLTININQIYKGQVGVVLFQQSLPQEGILLSHYGMLSIKIKQIYKGKVSEVLFSSPCPLEATSPNLHLAWPPLHFSNKLKRLSCSLFFFTKGAVDGLFLPALPSPVQPQGLYVYLSSS